MTHPSDDELRTRTSPDGHLAACAACRLRWQAWQHLAAATRTAARTLAPDVVPPPFAALLPGLVPQVPERPVPVPAPTVRRAWRTSRLLVTWQLRLMPRLLLPLTLVGLAVAVVIALVTADPVLATHYFAAGVVLVSFLGSLATCARRADPRAEVFFALPVSPVTVFSARLVLVLAVDLLFALAGSMVVHADGLGASVFDLVTGWLGQSLLASAIAVLGAVRFSPGAGAAAAVTAWWLGSSATLSRGVLAERVGRVAGEIWGTTPWTAVVALALFAMAVHHVGRLPARHREFA